MRKLVFLVSTTLLAGAGVATPVTAAPTTGLPISNPHTVRISVNSAEHEGNNISGRSSRPAVSGSGAVVAFDSIATNLVRGDTNHEDDVLVHDRVTQRTVLVSQGVGGEPADGSSSPVISADGRYVAFTSNATKLTRKPLAGSVFLHDLRTGRTSVLSVRPDGSAASGASPSLSAHGRYVAFSSFVSDIVVGDTNGAFDVFVRDRQLQQTTRVSVTSGGAQAEGGGSFRPAISAHGDVVAFDFEATNLVPADTNGLRDIFVHDTETAMTERVSVASDGAQSDGQSDGPGIRGGSSFGPDISANGRFVTFDSIATNLVPDDTNTCSFTSGGPSFPEPGACPDIFLRDRRTSTTTRMSVSSSGEQANDASTDPAISSDGINVVFFSTASFTARDTNPCPPSSSPGPDSALTSTCTAGSSRAR